MIKAVFYKRANGIYAGFQIKGHAGFAKYGKDIVCAAVSVLSVTTLNSIETFTSDTFETGEKDGFLTMKFTSKVSKESALLMDSFQLGLKNLQEDYNKYINVKVKEV